MCQVSNGAAQLAHHINHKKLLSELMFGVFLLSSMQCAGLCAKVLASTWRPSSDYGKSSLSAHFDHSENKLTTEDSSLMIHQGHHLCKLLLL